LKIAAIDIGSNAIRLQITSVLDYEEKITFKKIEYVRFPLRLGQDVFTEKTIKPETEEKFVKLMKSFKILIDLFEVDIYRACATSAMREAKNGAAIATRVLNEIGLKIDIINGDKEAEIINNSLSSYLEDKAYLHIDVGGGSTELNIYVNKQKVVANSFKIGSVRRLSFHQSPLVWKRMEDWIKLNIKKEYGRITAIGTGGNINKIADLAKKKPGKTITLKKIESVREYLEGFTLHERIHKLQLNPDRADVILPASEIYMYAMKAAKATSILVPDMGLKDGMIQDMYKKLKYGKTHQRRSKSDIV
jgi:exopolyphosphatase/guanosine-5'-triphosphate,3'-diphosphate pyrophosphatase